MIGTELLGVIEASVVCTKAAALWRSGTCSESMILFVRWLVSYWRNANMRPRCFELPIIFVRQYGNRRVVRTGRQIVGTSRH